MSRVYQMDYPTKLSLFSGGELSMLSDFCKKCAEEDRRLYEERMRNQNKNISKVPNQSYQQKQTTTSTYHPPAPGYYQYKKPTQPAPKPYVPPSNVVKPNNSYTQNYRRYYVNDPNNVNFKPDPRYVIQVDTFKQRLQYFGKK